MSGYTNTKTRDAPVRFGSVCFWQTLTVAGFVGFCFLPVCRCRFSPVFRHSRFRFSGSGCAKSRFGFLARFRFQRDSGFPVGLARRLAPPRGATAGSAAPSRCPASPHREAQRCPGALWGDPCRRFGGPGVARGVAGRPLSLERPLSQVPLWGDHLVAGLAAQGCPGAL